jgi:hypothetical protein
MPNTLPMRRFGITVKPMQTGSYVDINREILLATLEAFSKRGFCGELHCTFEIEKVLHLVAVAETHPRQLVKPADWHEMVAEQLGVLNQWLGLPTTVLTIFFNQGKITKTLTRDRKGWWHVGQIPDIGQSSPQQSS